MTTFLTGSIFTSLLIFTPSLSQILCSLVLIISVDKGLKRNFEHRDVSGSMILCEINFLKKLADQIVRKHICQAF